MKEINLFVGPLGTAHLRAASFASGMMKSFAIAELLDRVEALDQLINSDIGETEKRIAEQLKEELYENMISISEKVNDGTRNQEAVF